MPYLAEAAISVSRPRRQRTSSAVPTNWMARRFASWSANRVGWLCDPGREFCFRCASDHETEVAEGE